MTTSENISLEDQGRRDFPFWAVNAPLRFPRPSRRGRVCAAVPSVANDFPTGQPFSNVGRRARRLDQPVLLAERVETEFFCEIVGFS